MFCNKNQFPSLPFVGPHTKPHGVIGLIKHYHMLFDPKLIHGICAIRCIPCACAESTSMLEKPWIPYFTPKQQLCYRPVTDCSYWTFLGYFNNWNIITLSHKATTIEAFEDINKVVLDIISDNISSLVLPSNYGNKNKTYTSKMG